MNIKELWLKISEENRKRIVSFANTFIVAFLMFLAVQLDGLGFPTTTSAGLALLAAGIRTGIREALNALVNSLKK